MNPCKLNLTYNDDTWASEVSPDQQGCNDFIENHKLEFMGANVLHIGIGTSSVFTRFHNIFSRLDGLTIMQSEIDVASKLRFADACPYNIYNFNKYDINNFAQMSKDFSLIIDNNLSHYACCQQHWEDYFHILVELLLPGGIILTHSQGFVPHTQNVGILTVSELERLSGEKMTVHSDTSLKNSYNHCPVIIRKK